MKRVNWKVMKGGRNVRFKWNCIVVDHTES